MPQALSLGQIVVAGGWLMIPIVLSSLAVFIIIIERAMYFSSVSTDYERTKKDLEGLLNHTKIKEALEVCEKSSSPLARIWTAGLLKYGQSRESVREAMEDAGRWEMTFLDNRLALLGFLGQILPLIGLLGTAIGLCQTFWLLQAGSQALTPLPSGEVFAGIARSFITTIAALGVSLPAMMGYQFFQGKLKEWGVLFEMEAARLLARLFESSGYTMLPEFKDEDVS